MKTFNCVMCGTETKFGYSKTNKYCSRDCQTKHQRILKIDEWVTGISTWNANLPVPAWIKDSTGYLANRDG